jgi:hypothetical protein
LNADGKKLTNNGISNPSGSLRGSTYHPFLIWMP